MASKNVKKLVYHGALAAMIIVATAFLKIPAPFGYAHMGDGFIFTAAVILGPMAFIPAAIGSCIADFILGYAIYAPATFVIKGLMGFFAGSTLKGGGKPVKNLIVFILAEIIMIAGYFLYELVIYDGIAPAISGIPYNGVQGLCGVVMGMLFVPVAKRVKL